jgi:murein DD-endopeptidase MepM/ murein hydrolase activator NlpD
MRLLRALLALACGLGIGSSVGFGAAASELHLEGELVQGGLVRGQAAAGTRVWLDGRELRVSEDGWFVFGLDRDAPGAAELAFLHPDGREAQQRLEVAARTYRIQRIDGLPPRQVTPSEADFARIQADTELLAAARQRDSKRGGFTQPAAWPVAGPISGIYGSQRILNGEPHAPHRGVDVAAPAGTPVGAMASGVVSLAKTDMYYTGGTVMIDHGHGLHSIYAHLQKVLVEIGQEVAQGATLGTVGATGRATGPHLHWGVYWFEHALDPALLVGPMPESLG